MIKPNQDIGIFFKKLHTLLNQEVSKLIKIDNFLIKINLDEYHIINNLIKELAVKVNLDSSPKLSLDQVDGVCCFLKYYIFANTNFSYGRIEKYLNLELYDVSYMDGYVSTMVHHQLCLGLKDWKEINDNVLHDYKLINNLVTRTKILNPIECLRIDNNINHIMTYSDDSQSKKYELQFYYTEPRNSLSEYTPDDFNNFVYLLAQNFYQEFNKENHLEIMLNDPFNLYLNEFCKFDSSTQIRDMINKISKASNPIIKELSFLFNENEAKEFLVKFNKSSLPFGFNIILETIFKASFYVRVENKKVDTIVNGKKKTIDEVSNSFLNVDLNDVGNSAEFLIVNLISPLVRECNLSGLKGDLMKAEILQKTKHLWVLFDIDYELFNDIYDKYIDDMMDDEKLGKILPVISSKASSFVPRYIKMMQFKEQSTIES